MKLTVASSFLALVLMSSSADIGVQANTPFIIEKSPVDIIRAEGLPEINPALSYIGSIDQTESLTNTTFDLLTSTSATTVTTDVTKVTYYKVWVPFVTTMNSWQPRRIGEPRYAREVAEKVLDLNLKQGKGLSGRVQGVRSKEQEALLDEVDECSGGQRGFDLLVKSVQNTLDHGVGTSCTVFIDNKKRCVVDGGVWRECPGGYSIDDFVRSIKDAAGKVFRISW
ncbi:hypothetical protein BGX24_008165 [Mortierella sp. AD032]|nr:hypothetical protein BGX24_008165 [Mortierella sp. AD032]